MPRLGNLIANVAVDPANVAAGAALNVDVAIAEVTRAHQVIAFPPDTLEAGLVVQGVSVPADGIVRVRLYNPSAGGVDGASRAWNFLVIRED